MIYNFFRSVVLQILKILFFWKREKRIFFQKRLFQNFDDLHQDHYIWIHCASVGEINLSEPLVRQLLIQRTERLLFTCLTDTGMQVAKEKYQNHARITLKFFPLDDPKEIQRILIHFDSCLLILVETELWPNLISYVHKQRKNKIILINGRISDKSFGHYRKIKFFLRNILQKIDGFYMQSQEDVNRIKFLGANTTDIDFLGNLKFDLRPESIPSDVQFKYQKLLNISKRAVFVAGSTHFQENSILLNVFEHLKDTLLVLVPRHLKHIDKIENLVLKRGFSCRKFSNLESNLQSTAPVDVVLIDSIGKLRILYSICDIAFVGGTLVNIGGHSLLEPLCHGKTPIFGPYLQNVRTISKEILSRKIGYLVHNSDEFLESIRIISTANPKVRSEHIEAFFSAHRHVVERILQRLPQ